jgi:hypothetical protein
LRRRFWLDRHRRLLGLRHELGLRLELLELLGLRDRLDCGGLLRGAKLESARSVSSIDGVYSAAAGW